jgi:hypothetical protein
MFFQKGVSVSVLENIGGLSDTLSIVLLVLFGIVLSCHIPFVFFAAKESYLIIIDEI